MALLDRPKEGRSWLQRMTVLGGVLAAGSAALEPAGVIPPGSTAAGVAALTTIAGGFAALIGIYRQIAN